MLTLHFEDYNEKDLTILTHLKTEFWIFGEGITSTGLGLLLLLQPSGEQANDGRNVLQKVECGGVVSGWRSREIII